MPFTSPAAKEALNRRNAHAALEAEIGRRSFSDFCILNSPQTYEQPAQVKYLVETLEAMARNEIDRLIVEMPPRSSKSTHLARLFPSFMLGRRPQDTIVIASYGELLATGHGRAIRDILTGARYPFNTRLRTDMRAAGMWQTTEGGGLIAAGVGTGLTGFGGPLLVTDDLIKGREEADSALVRDNTWTWLNEVFMTRLQLGGKVIHGGTRWHEDDPIGRVLNSKDQARWTVVRIPYEAETGDPLGRVPGEKLHLFGEVPDNLSPYAYSALYQQRPTPAGGTVFKAEWMKRTYSEADLTRLKALPRWRVIQTIDLGGKQGPGHDPSAIATWGTDGISKYILDYWSGQEEYTALKAKVLAQNFLHRPRMNYVEDATWSQPLISDMRAAGVRIYPVPARGSKWTRADAVAPEFQGGAVVLPEAAPWLGNWVFEHTSFPNAPHDESVDTTSLALGIFPSVTTRPIVERLKHTKEAMRETPANRIRMKLKERRARE